MENTGMEENKNIDIVSDGSRLMSYEEYKRIKTYRRIALILVVVLTGIALFIAIWSRSFNSYKEVSWTQNTEGSGTGYALYLDGYLKYSKDGISCQNQKGITLWTEAYTMSKPVIAVRDSYAAVADQEGNSVYLYDESGKVGSYSMSYPVRKIMVAKQGVFCVVLDGDGIDYIRLYDKTGELLAEIKTQIEINGYPMAVDLSADGSKLVASYYRVEGINSQNILSFYNFGEGGKGQSGPLIGTFQFDDMIIPKVVFMENDNICAAGDNRMLVYTMSGKPKQIQEIVYPSELLNVFSSGKYIGFTCENAQELVQEGKAEPYEIYLYTANGKLKKHFGTEKVYETVQLLDNVFVGYSGTVCSMLRTSGTEMFCQDMERSIIDILPTNQRKEYIFVYSEGCARVRLTNEIGKAVRQPETESEE